MRMYSLTELNALPTLCVGQADDLKVETANMRVWLSRCTVEDGEPFNNRVSIESNVNDRWIVTCSYPAL
jgi:hypothetical protein